MAYLKDIQGVAENEAIVICPVDPYVEKDYFKALQDLCDRAGEGRAVIEVQIGDEISVHDKHKFKIRLG